MFDVTIIIIDYLTADYTKLQTTNSLTAQPETEGKAKLKAQSTRDQVDLNPTSNKNRREEKRREPDKSYKLQPPIHVIQSFVRPAVYKFLSHFLHPFPFLLRFQSSPTVGHFRHTNANSCSRLKTQGSRLKVRKLRH